MSDVVDIKELKARFEEKLKGKELQEFASSQQTLIEKLLIENDKLREKTKHLEQLLQSITTTPTVHKISAEELICIEQINILQNRSGQRELSLEEVKRLDLLIKNLRLLREPSTQVIDTVGHRDLKDEDLVRLATTQSTD